MTEAKVLDLDKTLARVRKLIALAEHEGTPPHEAALAREQADSLMLRAAIDEAMVRDSVPQAERQKPGIITVEIGKSNQMLGYISWLAQSIATHTRCKMRTFYSSADRSYMAKVYGFAADLRYFELLYTTTRLHMLGVIAPSIDESLTKEENAYRLHNAGYNWFEIAKMEGWFETYREPGEPRYMYKNRKTDERASYAQAIGTWKNAYLRAVKARGERPKVIPPSGSETYRDSAANGYVGQIGTRLRAMKRHQEVSQPGAIVLASSAHDLEAFFREDNPSMYTRCPRCERLSSNPWECEFCGQFIKDRPEPCEDCAKAKSGHCRKHPRGSRGRDLPFNNSAYSAGVAHANTADLAGPKMGASATRAVR